MNCLLDTSTLIWTLTQTDRLSKPAADIINNPSIVKHVSVISLFEISIKSSIGKLKLQGVEIDELPSIIYQRDAELIALEAFEAVAFHRLPLKENHRDPFDRMLICQAMARNLTLISSDEKIAQYRKDGLSLIW